MGSTVDSRPRKSTLSKIGKMFGVSDKNSITEYPNNGPIANVSNTVVAQQLEQQQLPNHPAQPQNNYTTNPRSNSSGSNPNSITSSNSSSSSVNQMTEFEKPKTPSRVGSRAPSRVSSVNHKQHSNTSNVSLNDDLSSLKLNGALKSAKKQQLQKDQQLNLNSSISEIPNGSSLKLPAPNSVGNGSSSQTGTTSPSMLSRSSSTASNHHNGSHLHLPAVASSTNLKNLPRFVVYEDGSHEHHLRNAKRQEKLSNMLKNLLGAQKLRDEAVSAVPDILSNNPPSLFSGLVNQFSNSVKEENVPFSGATRVQGVQASANTSSHSKTFAERYGRCQEVIGKGTFGVVRISHKKFNNSEKETLFAVKEFKRRPTENEQKYSRRLTSEFCISSSLKHVNIIETLDLLQDAKGDYVEVMEFCSGGDLYTLIIAAGKLEYLEADCFFKQLIRGVVYMHEMGVAHRDLKPENLLLTENGILKITDFGNGECFKMAWENDIHFSGGVCGSSPYIAPEEYTTKEFDPRSVDIWACGVIYMAMRTGRQLWRVAKEEDEFYRKYLEGRKSTKGYEPIEHMKRARCRNVIYSILDPVPSRRINGKQILNSEWGREIKCCI